MAVRKLAAQTARSAEPDPGAAEEFAAGVVVGTQQLPPQVTSRARRRSSQEPRPPRLGPTLYDRHMWQSYQSGQYARVTIPAARLQDVRIQLARAQRWLTYQHLGELKEKLSAAPYEFRTSLIVTDEANTAKLAEGPVKGKLTSPELEVLSPESKVNLWFRMHLPINTGRRAKPEAYGRLMRRSR